MSQQPQAGNNDPYKSQGSWSTYALVIGGIVLALMGGFALGRGGALGLIPGKGSEVSVAGPRPQNLDLNVGAGLESLPIEAGAAQSGPDTQLGFDPVRPNLDLGYQPGGPTTEMADKMPPEVRAWLEHLERTESERKRMTMAQMSQAMGLAMSASGAGYQDLIAEAMGEESSSSQSQLQNPEMNAQFKRSAPEMRKGWKDITAYFNSKQPPAECIPIKNAYEQCLGETSAMMLQLIGALESASVDEAGRQQALSTLYSMLGTSQGKIDVAGEKTDSLVGQVCRKYETYKWFKVSGDIGGGLGSLGLGGLGGLDLGGLLGGG